MPDKNHEQCAQLIKDSDSIVVLTGAGISTNAGIPDFRGPQGLYVTKKYDAEKIFDVGHFYSGCSQNAQRQNYAPPVARYR